MCQIHYLVQSLQVSKDLNYSAYILSLIKQDFSTLLLSFMQALDFKQEILRALMYEEKQNMLIFKIGNIIYVKGFQRNF